VSVNGPAFLLLMRFASVHNSAIYALPVCEMVIRRVERPSKTVRS
jgi:hypothetical protein